MPTLRDKFLPYQRAVFADGARKVVWEKSRRIGASWALAAEAVSTAMLGSGNAYYQGYSVDMSQNFIADCADFARQFGEVMPVEIQESDRDNKVYEATFKSGCHIKAIPSTPKSLRGKGKYGDIAILDEAAFFDDLEANLKAATPWAVWGARVIVLSTHNGEDSPFNQLVNDARAGRKQGWSVHRTAFKDAIKQGLFKKICETTGRQWTAAAEAEWEAEVRRDVGDNAAEELDAIPSPLGGAWLSSALIEKRMSDDAPLIRWSPPASDFVSWPDSQRTAETKKWIAEALLPPLAKTSGRGFVGVDFARSSDLSVFAVARRANNMSLTLTMVELRDCPFLQQEEILTALISRLDETRDFGGCKLDAGGNGAFLAERAAQKFGGPMVEAVNFSAEWYRNNMPRLKAHFEDGTIRIPKSEGVLDDFRAIKYERGVARVPDIRTADRAAGGGKRHGDSAVATALAVAAAKDETGPVEFVVPESSFADDIESYGGL